MKPAQQISPQTVRVILPFQLQTLARCPAEVPLELTPPVTQRRLLRALEARYPELSGAIVDHATGKRRPLLRFFAGKQDLSHHDPDAPLPEGVATGRDEFIILGAIAGG